MKKNLIILFLMTPFIILAQIKGKNSKDPFTSKAGKTYKKGDVIVLKSASNNDKFAYAYKFKSSLSLGNIRKTMQNVNDVKNLNVKSTKGIKNAINTAKSISDNELLNSSIASLQNKVVAESYIKDNALDSNMSGQKYTIKNFKVYTDKESGIKIVHAITKGKGGKVAILIDAAEEKGEM